MRQESSGKSAAPVSLPRATPRRMWLWPHRCLNSLGASDSSCPPHGLDGRYLSPLLFIQAHHSRAFSAVWGPPRPSDFQVPRQGSGGPHLEHGLDRLRACPGSPHPLPQAKLNPIVVAQSSLSRYKGLFSRTRQNRQGAGTLGCLPHASPLGPKASSVACGGLEPFAVNIAILSEKHN